MIPLFSPGPGVFHPVRRVVLLSVVLMVAACAPRLPRVQQTASVSPAAGVPWTPPAPREPQAAQPTAVELPQAVRSGRPLSLAEVVDTALGRNPATRAAWSDARAAAAKYGSSLGAWYPTVTLSGTLTRAKGIYDNTDQARNNKSASANLTYLLFDFGGRSAAVAEARQTLLAADLSYNAVIQNTILQAATAFFTSAGAQALLEADQASLADAEAHLAAAEERQRLGLATKADVLQARTAYAEAKLALQRAAGLVRTTRAGLAVAMGLPADGSMELKTETPEIPPGGLSGTVADLIARAMAVRPELQAARAQAEAAAARVRGTRSKMLPSLSTTASLGVGRLESNPRRDTYSGALQLQIPLFTGFSQQYDLVRAKAEAEAASERLRGVEQNVIYQVYTSHSDFTTAEERVKTSEELVASALQAEEMALGRYKEGVGSILDLLSTQRVLAQARAERIDAKLSWFVALARLAHDVGILGLHGENPLAPAGRITSTEVNQ